MLKILAQILLLYDELLIKTAVPERSHFLWHRLHGLHGFYDSRFRICDDGFLSQQDKKAPVRRW